MNPEQIFARPGLPVSLIDAGSSSDDAGLLPCDDHLGVEFLAQERVTRSGAEDLTGRLNVECGIIGQQTHRPEHGVLVKVRLHGVGLHALLSRRLHGAHLVSARFLVVANGALLRARRLARHQLRHQFVHFGGGRRYILRGARQAIPIVWLFY